MNKTRTTGLVRTFGIVVLGVFLIACSEDLTSSPSPQSVTPSQPTASPVADPAANVDNRPNILLIVADDMGYSDLGSFGSEISTPNLDQLASEGLTMTNFHVGPTCSPTRGMLLSGVDNHLNGLGAMNGMQSPEQIGQPGYEAYLNKQVVAFPNLLKDAGYHTYMAGKWQQGYTPEYFPLARGFEKAFWLKHGGASHFSDKAGINSVVPVSQYFEGNEEIEVLPEEFYSSTYYTDKLIEYIDANKDDGKPFFAFAAYRAPHWPLHAPPEYTARYDGVYEAGYEAIREQRIEKMRALGVLKPGQTPAPAHKEWPAWDTLSDDMKTREVKRMQIYAGMVENMDFNIGRLLSYLKAEGMFDNTLVLFFSDNGSDGNDPGDLSPEPGWRQDNFDNSLENIGLSGSYEIVGPGWAMVSNTPFNLYKGFPTEGGISTSFIAYHKALIPTVKFNDSFATVLDVLPTILEVAETEHPGTEYDGRTIFPTSGTSMVPLFKGETESVHNPDFVYAGELWNRKVVRQGDWKMTWINRPWGNDGWALFNLAYDIGEQQDLSDSEPERLATMIDHWEDYVRDNGVIENDDFYHKYSNSKSYYENQN